VYQNGRKTRSHMSLFALAKVCAIIVGMHEEYVAEERGVTHSKVPKRSNFLGILLALILAAGSFVSGMQIDSLISKESQSASLFSFFSTPSAKSAAATPDLTQFWKVWNLLDEKFIAASSTQSLSAEDKINGAIEGMVATYGDPYTVFLPPVESAAFAEDISGNFSGIGMEVGIRNGVVTIIAPLPETPAQRAGLLSGDIITRIDGVSTEGMRIDEAVKMIRGEKGTEVKLSIYREGDTEIREVTVVRDTISIPTVVTEIVDGVFVIRLYSFNALAEMKMQEALREYVQSGTKSMVLDLRGNPGGYLQSAVAIAGYFLPTGKVVVREHYGENDEEKLYRSQGRTLREFSPKELVVLIDNGSASASEILAGALREHGVAVLIGQDTFGKGSVQELISLSDGSSVKITVARWLTPNGVSISEGGLAPDIKITRTPEDRVNEVDPQQNAAIRYIKGEEVVSE
jgi:carboxyl-terminal processing protease